MSEPKRPDDDGLPTDTRGSVRADFDWSEVSPSTAVVETVAFAADQEPMALEPLYYAIDPDALDGLIRSGGTRSTDGDVSVRFALNGHQVMVQRTGSVVVRPDETRSESE